MMNKKFFNDYEKQNGFKFCESEKKLMLDQKFCCDTCGNDFRNDFIDFYIVNDRCIDKKDSMLCRNCYEDDYLTYCSLCEEMFENPKTPEETRLYVNNYASKEIGYPIGIYQVLKFPYFRCSILGDDFSINDRTVIQISKIDLRKLDYLDDDLDSQICAKCFDIFTGKTIIRNNYVNRTYGIHQTIYKRGLINHSLIQ